MKRSESDKGKLCFFFISWSLTWRYCRTTHNFRDHIFPSTNSNISVTRNSLPFVYQLFCESDKLPCWERSKLLGVYIFDFTYLFMCLIIMPLSQTITIASGPSRSLGDYSPASYCEFSGWIRSHCMQHYGQSGTGGGSSPSASVLHCQYHATSALYAFCHLSHTILPQ